MIAIAARIPDKTQATLLGDQITLLAWAILAVLSWLLVRRLPRHERGAWLVVAAYCSVIAIDKAVDLQIAFYSFVQWSVDVLDPWFGLRQHRGVVKVLLLVPMLIVTVGGTIWIVRQDRRLDRSRVFAIAGLVLVVLLVGVRALPGFGFLDEEVGWGLEAVSCWLIAAGLLLGFRGSR